MKCPECGVWTVVNEVRKSEIFGYRRRRECANGHKFTTQEVIVPEETVKEAQRNLLRGNLEKWVAVRQSRRKDSRKNP